MAVPCAAAKRGRTIVFLLALLWIFFPFFCGGGGLIGMFFFYVERVSN